MFSHKITLSSGHTLTFLGGKDYFIRQDRFVELQYILIKLGFIKEDNHIFRYDFPDYSIWLKFTVTSVDYLFEFKSVKCESSFLGDIRWFLLSNNIPVNLEKSFLKELNTHTGG